MNCHRGGKREEVGCRVDNCGREASWIRDEGGTSIRR